MSPSPAQAFNTAEFEHALAVLESEQKALQLTRGQRLSLRFYSAFIGGFVVFLIAVIAYLAIKFHHEQELTDHEDLVLGILGVGLVTCLGAAVISLFLNLQLLLKIVRSRLRFRSMGFSDGSVAMWQAHQKTRRVSAFLEKIAVGLSILFLVITVIVAAYQQWGWAAAVLCVSIVFAMFYVLQNGKAHLAMMSSRLAELARLKESMQHLASNANQAGDGRIALPTEVIQQYSQVESEQIARSRAQAISESLKSAPREFSVLSSQQVRQAKAALAPGDRLKVEEVLDGLMGEPRPATAQAEPGDVFLLPVSGTDLLLAYKVDDGTQQLRLLALKSSPVGSATRA